MPARPPSLRAIAAFEAAARHESFAKAAEELNLTQSAISHSIRGLEERLGARLFARRGRNVVLSEDGRSLAERLRVSLVLLSQALEGVAPAPTVETLVVAAPSIFAHRALIRRWARAASGHPGLSVEVRPDLGVRAVQSGEADLCIDHGAGAYAGLASRLLGRELLFPVAAPGVVGDPDDLAGAELIENTEHSWALWFGHLQSGPARRTPALSVRDWRLALDAAAAGLGVCLTTRSLASEALRRGELVRVGEASMPALHACHVVWRAHGPKVRLVGRFVDSLLGEPDDRGEPAQALREVAA